MVAKGRTFALAIHFLLTGLAAIALLLFPNEFVPLWGTSLIAAILVLLVCGSLGEALKVNHLVRLGKAGSWVMLICLVATAIPDHEYFREHGLAYPSFFRLFAVFVALLIIPVGLLLLHKRLGLTIQSSNK